MKTKAVWVLPAAFQQLPQGFASPRPASMVSALRHSPVVFMMMLVTSSDSAYKRVSLQLGISAIFVLKLGEKQNLQITVPVKISPCQRQSGQLARYGSQLAAGRRSCA